ncbi:ATP-dependent DNA helicase [Methylobacterium indicum]|uniref:ATP-binding protein n=1 Tax=Methylobacterium indicum TaxID=1775910 RepID=A0A8H8X1K0_9HYPH|nr:AAA family ATPase [Methylobacterium indicum]BCM87852.1 ATP-binding protein [Methylobacterium indicum]
MAWSPQQEAALKAVSAWRNEKYGDQVFYLAGFAGTGKTTLAIEMARDVKKVEFGAFTGKAALVMQKKGCEGASTLHSLIYRKKPAKRDRNGDPVIDTGDLEFEINPLSRIRETDLVIVDECSMVGEELGRDLLSFGKKVLVLGDPAQLPPVKGAGFFTSREPDVMLTEVHRQAEGNPIIRMSMRIRAGDELPTGTYGDSLVLDRSDLDPEQVINADQILVGMNRTRQNYNARLREMKDLDPAKPQVGDKLVCLKNDHDKGFLNGGLWNLAGWGEPLADECYSLVVQSEDVPERAPASALVRREFFHRAEDRLEFKKKRGTQEFTYGYALTCHKSQGSQWEDVMVFDESRVFGQDAGRWLYTAITRASEKIILVR